eukprot:jgi/Tetstr1/454846/TSEL_000324.t1
MLNGDTLALDFVRERYLSHGTENTGFPEFTELLELYKDHVYHVNGGGKHDNFKNASPARATAAPRTTFAKDVTKNYGNIEALYGTDDWGAKVLHLQATSLTAITYSNYEDKIRLFAEFCIDEEGFSPRDFTEATYVRYLA